MAAVETKRASVDSVLTSQVRRERCVTCNWRFRGRCAENVAPPGGRRWWRRQVNGLGSRRQHWRGVSGQNQDAGDGTPHLVQAVPTMDWVSLRSKPGLVKGYVCFHSDLDFGLILTWFW